MARFHAKLLVAMMLVVLAVTLIALYLTQRDAAAAAAHQFQRDFQAELSALHRVQELRHAALAERCRTLVRRPRIHAALEDNALDLLYPSAMDELRDIMHKSSDGVGQAGGLALNAVFYRFLDRTGSVLAPPGSADVGLLGPNEEEKLNLKSISDRQEIGYLPLKLGASSEVIVEVFAMPIISSETGEAIAALVLGFEQTLSNDSSAPPSGIRRGVWLDRQLYLDGLSAPYRADLADEVARSIEAGSGRSTGLEYFIEGVPHLLFFKQLNPGSAFPPAYEVCVYSLADLRERQRELRWQVLGAAALLLVGGFGASHVLAGRLARPVEKLAVDSAENLAKRERAEAALESTHEELQRAARFSADASHQLKTPVTVLRAGLEELLARENLSPDECHEISALIHQTYRLSNVIEDLLLLSRMDAGRVKIDFGPVHLSQLIEAALDDLSAQPNSFSLEVENDFPTNLWVAGEKRYLALILQNLLENARKYNQPKGRIRLTAREEDSEICLTVSNTGRPISPAAQAHIFERFHRGEIGENVPGYGLGLNLAREMARLHGGELRLVRSDEQLTEFEVRFRLAQPPSPAEGSVI